jgi:hypothetical protein
MTPSERFAQLKASYRSLVPGRRISAARRRQIAWAASAEQIREVATLELALGRPHNPDILVQLRADIRTRLIRAGAKIK